MEGSTAQNFMWVIVALTFVSFFTIMGWVIRLRNQKVIAPSKKNPDGRMIMEIWTTGGDRHGYLVSKKAGGYEVEPPDGLNRELRYFYSKSAVGRTKYPTWMPFDFLRVESQIASWWENHSAAIDPEIDYCPHPDCGKEIVIATQAIPADMQKMLQARDVIGAGDDLLRDDNDRQAQLSGLIGSLRTMKWLPLIAGIAAIAAVVAAVFAMQASRALGG